MTNDRDPAAASSTRRPRWRLLAWILGGLAAAIVLLAVVVVAFVQSSAFEEQVRARVLPRISEQLGREVSFESVEASVFPLGARVEGLRVAGSGERPLALGTASARVALWPLLFSGGKRVEVQRIDLEDMELNLVRLQSGSYDLPDMEREGPSQLVDIPTTTIEGGTLRLIDPAKGTEVVIEDVEGRASIRGQVVEIESLKGEGYEGTLRLDGSRIDLSQSVPSWVLQLEVEGVELGALPSRPLDGSLGSYASLEGEGLESGSIQRSLSGSVELELRDADWERLNLEAAILTEVVRELQAVGLLENAPASLPEGTDLGDVNEELTVEDGWLSLDQPLEVRTSFGVAEISGRIALDQRLDLEATTSLPPSLLADLSGGRLEIGEPVPIRVGIGGTLSQPSITEVGTEELAPLLLREGIRRLPDSIPDSIPELPKLPISAPKK